MCQPNVSYVSVLNLIINGIPSIPVTWADTAHVLAVLNLIINGIPSIHCTGIHLAGFPAAGFKPYYKWNTFNTVMQLTRGYNI